MASVHVCMIFVPFYFNCSLVLYILRAFFNKTIIPLALVGYEMIDSQLGATRLVGYLSSHIQRALMEKLLR